jgi:hypothetical protein
MVRSKWIATILFAGLALACLPATPAQATELKPQTAEAFDLYIRTVEARMKGDLDKNRFLAMDRLPDAQRQEAYAKLRRGELYIQPLRGRDDITPIHVAGGLIHHWVGIIFIPGASFSQTVAVIQDYDNEYKIFKPDIQKSKQLECDKEECKVFLQLYYKSLVTAVLNAFFDTHYFRFGDTRGLVTSYSTRIAQVENANKPNELELPVGMDSGYMWRLYSYWRVEEKNGGTYLEIEVITLSRTIAAVLAPLVIPLIRNVPRSILSDLLNGTRIAVTDQRKVAAGRPAASRLAAANNISIFRTAAAR